MIYYILVVVMVLVMSPSAFLKLFFYRWFFLVNETKVWELITDKVSERSVAHRFSA